MKLLLSLICLLLAVKPALGEDRFGRPVVKVKDPSMYHFIKSDDIEYPTLSNERFSISCLTYRGTQHYYVEVSVTNNTSSSVFIPTSFIDFGKPGYTVYRSDTMVAAREAAFFAGVRFIPTPPPYVPPTYQTTVNATAATYGDQTSVSGTATTTTDYSGQAGANFGNAVGNAIAARRFYKAQRIDAAFSHFLSTHAQTDSDTPLQPGQSRIIVATFDEIKPRKKPFDITLKIDADTFRFTYKE